MQIHAGDMKGYIQSGKGLYKSVKEWVDTGRYSSGTYKTVYVHQESDAYRVYSSGLYKDTVAVASTVQGNAQKIEAISGIVGGLANVASQLEITTPTIDISNVAIVNGNGTLSTIPTLTLQGEFAVSVSGTLEGTAAGITAMGIYGGGSSGGQSKDSLYKTPDKKYLTNQDYNDIENMIQSGKDVEFASKEQALEFINKKYSHLNQEIAGSRSKEGWHFDSHSINNSTNNIDHINLYTKNIEYILRGERENSINVKI